MEIIVTLGIFSLLFGLVVANYRRGSDDSLLSRETALLVSRLRFAQEHTIGGQVSGFCGVQNLDMECTTDTDCTNTGTGANACTHTTASGGYGMFFSCQDGISFGDNHWPDLTQYFMFGDRVMCLGSCFPFSSGDPNWDVLTNAFKNMDTGKDYLFSSDKIGSTNYYKGDTIRTAYSFDPRVTLLDIQLIEAESAVAVTCDDGSPWRNKTEPAPQPAAGTISDTYPLQAIVDFSSPDGRTIVLSDNVSIKTPTAGAPWNLTGGKLWKEVQLMVALKTRPTSDCRIVRVTKEGVITHIPDGDCTF